MSGQPFTSYVSGVPEVNWSEELEQLHEESSRTHFIDLWTRGAMLERIGSLPAKPTLLDLGCSTGHLLEDLRGAHPQAQLIGVDLVAGGLRKAHAGVPSARLLQADVSALPLEVDSVDGVLSANLLEHVPDDLGALAEMRRVLRGGGRAVIVVPAGPRTYDYYDRFLGHERRYGRGELAAKAARVGFEVLEDTHIGALIYPAFWAVKQRNRRRFAQLEGDALQRRVASDIAGTRDSRVGRLAWALERRLPIAMPFGIRSLVVLR